MWCVGLLFLFQVEAGIRVRSVSGVQPCALPFALRTLEAGRPTVAGGRDPGYPAFLAVTFGFGGDIEIGRASSRDRAESTAVAVASSRNQRAATEGGTGEKTNTRTNSARKR